MRALFRSLGRFFNPNAAAEIWPDREWCCPSCAEAWLLGRLAEAARARERAHRFRATGSGTG